jgi:hypothetical protein
MESSNFSVDQPAASISVDIREVLFGDEPLEKVAAYAQGLERDNPWARFATASQLLADGDAGLALPARPGAVSP